MENNKWTFNPANQPGLAQSGTVARSFLSGVFSWMGTALAISAITAWVFGNNVEYMQYLFNMQTGGLSGLGYVVMFAPLAFVLIMSFGFNKLSTMALSALFLVYSVIMGMSLSFIFMIYTQTSIVQVFAASAGMFALMGFIGYTTKTDLTKLGSLLFMALIGIIIASLINIFMKSEGMSYIISFIAVIVFTGLTAYDVQKLKNIGAGEMYGEAQLSKLSIMGALTLYLDFINLFLALLRLFGSRRD